MPLKEASAVGAGFGWYSLSGVILSQIYSVEAGALAFLTNVMREIIAFVLIPVLAARIGSLAAVAPGGATTMDTTLPLIARSTDADTTVIAFVNGATLSAMVPVLVPLLIGL
ncbi:MAG: lysine exporter LysO family protein [Bacillota bacterium]